jgi:hypothetical protein
MLNKKPNPSSCDSKKYDKKFCREIFLELPKRWHRLVNAHILGSVLNEGVQ